MSRSSSSLKERIWKRLTLTDDPTEFREYQTTWLLRLCRRLHEAVVLLLVSVPPLYEAFVLQSEQKKWLRRTVQFSFGLFLGLLFHLIILVELQMDEKLTYIIGICIALFLAIGNVVSSQIRCISLLVPIRFGTSTGRNVMMAMVIVYLTAGPITNITNNLQEALRVIICQLWKTFTLTKNRFELMFVPLGEAFVKIRANTDQTKNLLDTVNQASNTIKDEVLGQDEIEKLRKENDDVDKKSHQSTNATPATLLKEDNLILWTSDVEPYEIRYNWTLPYFSSLSAYSFKCKEFPTSQNTKFSWIVGFELNNRKENFELYVRLSNASFEKAIVKVKASIIDNQLKEVRSKEKLEELVVNGNKIKWDEFCKIDDDFRNQLLVDDKLTISLQISCFIQCSNFTPISSFEPNIVKCDLSNNLNSLLENPKFADVKLSVNGKSYLAHKAVLAARSRVFARLFEDLDEEYGKKRNKIIMNSTYFDEDVMKAMLQYIYTGKCEAVNKLAGRLLVVADEYELYGLKNSCSTLLEGSLSVENAINTLQLADTRHSNELKSKAIDFIVKNSVQVLSTTEWKNMLISNVHLANEIIQRLAQRLSMSMK